METKRLAPALAALLCSTFPAVAHAGAAAPAAPAAAPVSAAPPQAVRAPARTATGERGPVDPAGLRPYDVARDAGAATGDPRAFNPAIAVIPDIGYALDDRDGGAAAVALGAAGFGPGDPDAEGGEPAEGFRLRETEITFTGAVDPYFEAWAIASFDDEGAGIEEAYVQTSRLAPGLTVKIGKFWSGIGYLNKQHPHQWDFADAPLSYDLVLGGRIDEVGIQATYLPAWPVYVLLGVEALDGSNAGVARVLEAGDGLEPAAGPRLFTGFVKIAPDLGASHALQMGVFAGGARRHQERIDLDALLAGGEEAGFDPDAPAYQGHTVFAGTDWVWRHDSGRPFGAGDASLQAEWVWRRRSLDPAGADAAGAPLELTQDGLYVQASYGFRPRWRASLRGDVAGLVNRVEAAGEVREPGTARRVSAAVTFDPTEFSRLRAQWSRGSAIAGGARRGFDQLFLQLQVSLGAHGAHAF